MAHREAIGEELSVFLDVGTFYWAISSNVGYTCRNKKEDVQLVQFFLNTIFEHYRKEDEFVHKPIVVDGKFGGETWGAIKCYQKFMTPMLVVDGMVSAADGNDEFTPKQSMSYTIHWLNSMYSTINPQYYRDIRMDPLLPSELCAQLTGPLPDLV